MVPLRTWILLAAVIESGCHRRATDETRQAFEAARAKEEADRRTAGEGDADTQRLDTHGKGWARVAAMIELAAQELASGDAGRVAALGERWCSSEPTPQDTPYGPVVVCFPEPPIVAGGQGFTLEMGGSGMVGLVASSLGGAASQKLAATLRKQASSWCASALRPIRSRENAHEDLHTCALDDGTVLTVARLPRDLQADLWQVSLVVLGAT